MKSRYIAIEGPIGVGKTSLAKLLNEELNGRLLLEDVAAGDVYRVHSGQCRHVV